MADRVAGSFEESIDRTENSCKETVMRRELFCLYSDCLVPKTTYYRHREQFHDSIRGIWSAIKLKMTWNAETDSDYDDDVDNFSYI